MLQLRLPHEVRHFVDLITNHSKDYISRMGIHSNANLEAHIIKNSNKRIYLRISNIIRIERRKKGSNTIIVR